MSARASSPELRKFGLIVGGIFAGLFGALLPWMHHARLPIWPWALTLILVVLAVFAPNLLYYPHIVWDRIGKTLGWINSRVILNILFFLVFVPAGLIAAAFGWDPLKRKLDPEAASYRVPSSPHPAAEMEKPY